MFLFVILICRNLDFFGDAIDILGVIGNVVFCGLYVCTFKSGLKMLAYLYIL